MFLWLQVPDWLLEAICLFIRIIESRKMHTNKENFNVGIVSTGIYIPEGRMTAAQISAATNGQWTENAIIDKLGIIEKSVPGIGDGTQEMGARAAINCRR